MHPEWSRSCGDCVKWLYDYHGNVCTRAGKPSPRPAGTPTPCHKCPKIPAGEPPIRANAVELSERNFAAYVHYLECRAVGQFPDDPIVRRNARILRGLFDEVDKVPMYKLIAMLGLRNV